jgi:NTP pyrophosphatase (non-canonical NTP hydrolase)
MKQKDNKTTLEDLQKAIGEFVSERNWDKFQNIRNLAISLSLESNELLDHFQWFNDSEVEEFEKDEKNKEEVGEELADILAYILIAADRMKIDLSSSFIKKIEKNKKKYPAEKFQNLTWEEDNKKYQKSRNEFGD